MTVSGASDTAGFVLEPPRFEDGRPLLLAGLRGTYSAETMKQIPELWQRLVPHLGRIPGQIGGVAYGVCYMGTRGNFDYICGVEVSDHARLPAEWSRVSIPALHYAVFPHREPLSKLCLTLNAIWQEWLPTSGRQPPRDMPGVPNFFERYSETFDPQAAGGLEVWVPIGR